MSCGSEEARGRNPEPPPVQSSRSQRTAACHAARVPGRGPGREPHGENHEAVKPCHPTAPLVAALLCKLERVGAPRLPNVGPAGGPREPTEPTGRRDCPPLVPHVAASTHRHAPSRLVMREARCSTGNHSASSSFFGSSSGRAENPRVGGSTRSQATSPINNLRVDACAPAL